MKMEDIRSNLGENFIVKITNDFIVDFTRSQLPGSPLAERLRAKINEVRERNYDAEILELMLGLAENKIELLLKIIEKLEAMDVNSRGIVERLESINVYKDECLSILVQKPKLTAKKGGQAKAIKTEKCRREFLRLVDERKPPFDKSKVGLAEAVLELKPLIVKYAKENQSSVITASTNLPVKWLNQHWNLPKRSYKKT